MSKKLDLNGKEFEYLTVMYENGRHGKRVVWHCKCKCGNETDVMSTDLTTGNTKSCGCRKIEKQTHHGMCNTKFYSIWKHMKQRCYNKNKRSYRWYGRLGITVCDRWHKFENFKEDMYESYLDHVNEFGEDNTSIDRINNNKNYESSNCRWVTWDEQYKNKRRKGEIKWEDM